MNAVPPGWSSAKLNEIVDLRTGPFGSALHKSDYVVDGAIPIINPMHIEDGRIEPTSQHRVSEETAEKLREFAVAPGDVVLGRRGEMGRCAVVGQREAGWLCGTGSLLVRAKTGLSPIFIRLLLSSDRVVRYLAGESVGSTMVNLNQQILLNLDVAVPPTREQERIIEAVEVLLSELDAGVAELKTAQRKLAAFRQSLLKAAVEGTLTADWRAARANDDAPQETGADLLQRILAERRARWEQNQRARYAVQGKTPPKGWQNKYPQPAAPDLANLPDLPAEWTWAMVEQLAQLVSGHTPKDAARFADGNATVPWFKVGDMNTEGNEEWLALAATHFSAETVLKLGLKQVPAGTIVFPKRGGAIATNKKRRLRVEGCYDLNMMGLVAVPDSAEWLWLWFQSVDLASLSDGSNVPQINNPDIAPLCAPLPPSQEQARIIEQVGRTLDSVNDQEQAVGRMLNQAAAQRRNILKAAFAGRLVPQDPADEPASVLLERIRAARATQGPTTRKRGRKARENA